LGTTIRSLSFMLLTCQMHCAIIDPDLIIDLPAERSLQMTFRYNEPVSVKALGDLRESVGWNRMEKEYGNPAMNSFYHIAVYDDEKLIGYVDCVSNGVTDAYIQDLIVHPDYQGKGLGSDLMWKMISYLKEKPVPFISVLYEESLKSFYEKFGFYTMLCGQMDASDHG